MNPASQISPNPNHFQTATNNLLPSCFSCLSPYNHPSIWWLNIELLFMCSLFGRSGSFWWESLICKATSVEPAGIAGSTPTLVSPTDLASWHWPFSQRYWWPQFSCKWASSQNCLDFPIAERVPRRRKHRLPVTFLHLKSRSEIGTGSLPLYPLGQSQGRQRSRGWMNRLYCQARGNSKESVTIFNPLHQPFEWCNWSVADLVL